MIKVILPVLILCLALGACNSETSANVKPSSALDSLNSPAAAKSGEPYLFTDSDGKVYLSWIEENDGLQQLKFSTLEGNNWSGSKLIDSGRNWFVNWADYPVISANGNNMIASILEKSANGKYTYDIKVLSSTNRGETWSTRKILHDDGKLAEHGFVSIVPLDKNFFVSWLDGRNSGGGEGDHHGHGGSMTIRGALVDTSLNKIEEWELDNKVCDCCQTAAAITTNGPVVLYRDRSDEEIRDISIVRMVGGKWTTPKAFYNDGWKITGCPVNGPRADAREDLLVVAWFSSPGDNEQVNVAFSQNGGETFDKAIRVDEGAAIGRVDIHLLDEKSAMVTWMEGDAIKAARVYINGQKDPSITVAASSKARSSGFPQMTRSNESVIFAWTDAATKKIKTAMFKL